MSGRLVILPHKSWNVWNQDNREKVLRDERKHREAEEAKAENEKRLLQEQNLELLRGTNASTLDEPSADVSGPVVPFRLFEDLEKKHFDQLGNADYLREKAAKELAQKKREGLADWALGEGSYECTKTKPWYSHIGTTSHADVSTAGSIVKNGKTTALQREEIRKSSADPMSTILVPNAHDYVPKRKVPDTELPACAPVEATEAKEELSGDDGSCRSGGGHKRKRHKRDRDYKAHKEHKSHKSSKEKSNKHDRGRSHQHSAHRAADTAQQPDDQKHRAAEDPWAELRQRRLEREAVERKRAALLLAQTDIYGTGGQSSGGSAEYSQQYHPHLARHHRK